MDTVRDDAHARRSWQLSTFCHLVELGVGLVGRSHRELWPFIPPNGYRNALASAGRRLLGCMQVDWIRCAVLVLVLMHVER